MKLFHSLIQHESHGSNPAWIHCLSMPNSFHSLTLP
ncbi:MAG: hypothetical protein MRECE_13c031 [Mycoplasmataceae bacterium CE_OT135]|nr:MAG: hypothetical protein MRECE_13c031 [Mycoplasmataceae bacterium CE_OT135]